MIDGPEDGDPQAKLVLDAIFRAGQQVSKAKASRPKDVVTFKATDLAPDVILKLRTFNSENNTAFQNATREYARQISLYGPAAVLEALGETFKYLKELKVVNNA